MDKKTMEEMLAAFRNHEVVELSPDELETVAGDVPDSFTIFDDVYSRDQLYGLVSEVDEKFGPAVAYEFLGELLQEAGYKYVNEAVDAYRDYGSNMWKRLDSLGI